MSPVHEPASVLIPDQFMDRFLEEIFSCDREFVSGYQYLHTDREFTRAANQILRMKNRKSSLRVHIECVSATDANVIRGFIRHILPVTDSLGLNENELVLLMNHLPLSNLKVDDSGTLTPVKNIEAALALCKTVGLKRLHLHTFGYYILVIRGDVANALTSRNALLYASREVANAAMGTEIEISEHGIRVINAAAEAFQPGSSPGIFLAEPYVIVVVPTLIAKNVKKTVGLGDIISSTAFVADVF